MKKYPAIMVMTGASGAGKTTLLLKLNELAIPGVRGINCDRVKVTLPHGTDATERQSEILRYWTGRLAAEKPGIRLAVLDSQIRPHRAQQVLDQEEVLHSQIVLIDCVPEIRNERLRSDRNQAHLANPQMDCWAAYLRGQADALDLAIIDTSNEPLEASLKRLAALVNGLLNQTGMAGE